MEKLIFLLLCSNVIAWNFETKTAVVFNGQSGTYFGFSVAIHKNSQGILPLVTATKADSANALYKCNITNTKCENVILDTELNANKDSWLGVSLDVQMKEKGHIVICGHLWKLKLSETNIPLGTCYLLNNNFKRIKKITPFKDIERQVYTFRTAFSQAGMSVSFGQNGDNNLLIGSPGYDNWKGGMVKYLLNNQFNDNTRFIFNLKVQTYSETYIGYSVSLGNFFNSDSSLYAAGAPRDGNYTGKVYIVDEKFTINIELQGLQTGEYFGASILSVDANNDNLADLFVGAPLYSTKSGEEEGRVYHYLSNGERLLFKSTLHGSSIKNSRFGTSLAYIGDINQDGYSDIAIGAPYELKTGAIYIYHGSFNGIKSQFVQKISGADIDQNLRGFGISISRPIDVDSNNYPDILVGSFLSDNAVLLRTRPIVRVFPKIEFYPRQINPDISTCDITTAPCFKTKYCFKYEGTYAPSKLSFIVELHAFRVRKFLQPRNYFTNQNRQTSSIRHEIAMDKGKRDCIKYDTYIRDDSDDRITPIQINSIIFLKHNISKERSFCKDCPILDPTIPHSKSEVITFRTGCRRSDKCSTDLKLKADVFGLSNGELIIGKDKEITIVAEIQHSDEPAFKTEMWIYLPESVELIKGDNCKQSRETSKELILICLIGNPFNKKLAKYKIRLDSSKLSPSLDHLSIVMNLTTLSEEINPVDNSVNITIPIKLSADIAITGRAERELILLKKDESQYDSYEFVHVYNVMKYLYSPISLVTVTFSIPTKLTDTKTTFVNLESVKILNTDHSSSVSGTCNFTNRETENDNKKNDDRTFNISNARSKRSVKSKLTSVNVDKNAILNCDTSSCETIVCFVGPFDEKSKSSTFYIKGNISVQILKSALKEWDNLTFSSEGKLSINDKRMNIQPANHKPDKTRVTTNIVTSVVSKRGKIAKWILPVSIACGIVLIVIILLVLLKVGFFRRKKREDIQQLKANLIQQQSPIDKEVDKND